MSRVGGREGEGYISIPEQTRTMDAKAAEKGVTVLPEVFCDENASGGNTDRAEFQRARDLIRARKVGGIIVATLDRFSRDVPEALAIIREIEAHGGRLLCGDGDVSLASGSDEFMATVRLATGQFERSRRTEYLDKSVRNAIERGVHLSAPFGYRKAENPARKGERRGSPLEVHPAEAPSVKLAFELRAAGASWPSIAHALNEAGVLPRPHKRHGVVRQANWSHKAVLQIVANEVYTGVAYNGKRRHPGAHEPLVSAELFAKANRARGSKPIGPKEGYALTGLARCASCGYAMVHQGGAHRYYRCRNAANGDCPGVNVPAGPLETFVQEQFIWTYLSRRVRQVGTDEAVTGAEADVERCEAALAGLFALAATLGDMSAAERRVFDANVHSARAALGAAGERLAQARSAAVGVTLPADLTADGFYSMPVPERRRLLGLAYACVVVRSGRALNEPVPDRARLIGRDEAPIDSTGLIAYVAGLNR